MVKEKRNEVHFSHGEVERGLAVSPKSKRKVSTKNKETNRYLEDQEKTRLVVINN